MTGKLQSFTETRSQFVAPLDISAEGAGRITVNGEEIIDQRVGPITALSDNDVLINLATREIHRVVEIMDNGLVVITAGDEMRKVPQADLERHLHKVFYLRG